MTIVPHPADRHAEPAPFAYPRRFNPLHCAWPTQTALASLYALEPGWYRVDHLAQALAAELPIGEKWLVSMFSWAGRDGVLPRRRHGAWPLVHIEPGRMGWAWPEFDYRRYLVVPLDVDPIDTGPRAA